MRRSPCVFGLLVAFLGLEAALAQDVAADIVGPQPDASAAAPDNRPALCLRPPAGEIVPFHGIADFDEAGKGTHSMIYPAPNVVGFLVEVATHSVLVESSKSSQKDEIQNTADAILLPYQSFLKHFQNRDLLQRALEKSGDGRKKRILGAKETPGSDLCFSSEPAFAMTQDQHAIVLENSVADCTGSANSADPKRYVVRVVSDPRDDKDPVAFCSADEHRELQEQSAALVAQSPDIALKIANGLAESSAHFRTVRYRQGGADKMERAQVLQESCSRMLIKTLRGEYYSVPVRSQAAGECVEEKPRRN